MITIAQYLISQCFIHSSGTDPIKLPHLGVLKYCADVFLLSWNDLVAPIIKPLKLLISSLLPGQLPSLPNKHSQVYGGLILEG